jgi:hypothetical protein
LSIREIAGRDLRDVLSELTELMGEFKEDDESVKLIRDIDRDSACDTKSKVERL